MADHRPPRINISNPIPIGVPPDTATSASADESSATAGVFYSTSEEPSQPGSPDSIPPAVNPPSPPPRNILESLQLDSHSADVVSSSVGKAIGAVASSSAPGPSTRIVGRATSCLSHGETTGLDQPFDFTDILEDSRVEVERSLNKGKAPAAGYGSGTSSSFHPYSSRPIKYKLCPIYNVCMYGDTCACGWHQRCPYGDRCHFAHGSHELRQKLCNYFLAGKHCPFGKNCKYLHATSNSPRRE